MYRTFRRSVPAFVASALITLFGSALIALPAATLVPAHGKRDEHGSRPCGTLDNPGDPDFDRLLGSNDEGVIVGLHSDGTRVHGLVRCAGEF